MVTDPGPGCAAALAVDGPGVIDTPESLSLRFAEIDLQSRMSKRDPIALTLDYTRSMMAFLLFAPRPRRIALIGLGGGSLAKFCHHELPDTDIDVIEIDPRVVALRDRFQVPHDDARFRVHIDDGARFIAATTDRYDVILLDGYTEHGVPASLASHKFHRDCRDALRIGGIMVSNLHGRDVLDQTAKIRRTYRDQVLELDDSRCSNRILFAFKSDAAAAPGRPALDGTLLDSPRLRAILPSLLARVEPLALPERKSVARR
ncbi:MAG TPA: fused MFS/spermidine synthase [Patescibacteria group bacterium]|nr:fused MFS/spermidine synthase [Patescibacteria group bacterium]